MKTEFKLNGQTLRIVQEDSGIDSPRNWDNLTTMVCFHGRHNIGDKTDYKSSNYNSFEELKQDIIKREKPVVILPLYMYDHSGQTISTKPFSCPWDSGQIGYVFVSRQKALEEYSVKRITKEIKERCEKVLLGEVETCDQYIRGDVYGFELLDESGSIIDSCYGFYGSDLTVNGILDHVDENWKTVVVNC